MKHQIIIFISFSRFMKLSLLFMLTVETLPLGDCHFQLISKNVGYLCTAVSVNTFNVEIICVIYLAGT